MLGVMGSHNRSLRFIAGVARGSDRVQYEPAEAGSSASLSIL